MHLYKGGGGARDVKPRKGFLPLPPPGIYRRRLSPGSVRAHQEELSGVHLENTFGPRVSGFVVVAGEGDGGGLKDKRSPRER